ncbi:2Fe-2S iron-sulfur cluster-binding protein [Streptomyces sp. CdTB01]|uniref:2Fe-2S iron-sulfur cluster-binding protein n=1 Tax=Streptomyces sp. CdTB01 TaxID=1725411 RepID=UPI00073ADAB3|nr:2Fe-2S iron-sulfur cluster-binding protein [Streptomyces sp. CdTB01]ALV38090.1 phenylacetate-CoA oxygenase [Streptomyces sp. CdTB01]
MNTPATSPTVLRPETSAEQPVPGGQSPRWHSATVGEVCRLTPDAVAVTLEVPARLREVFAHRPGQHVIVRYRRADGELRRAYSLCPPPHDPTALRLVIKRGAPDGFGAHAARLSPGDRLELSSPTGHFTLPDVHGAHHVLIAGGSGITPLAALAADALLRDTTCRVSLVHSVPTAAHALLSDELAALKDTFLDRFSVLYVLTREEQAPGGGPFRGRIDADMLSRLLTALDAEPAEDTSFALCGPPEMIATIRRCLDAWGAPPSLVRWELFTAGPTTTTPAADPSPTRPPADSTSATSPAPGTSHITALLGGHRRHTTVGPHDTVILDALLRAHPDVPYACREGVCGSCRAKILSGRVRADHQHALDDRDRAAGYTLVCRARPDTAEVVLDFDA